MIEMFLKKKKKQSDYAIAQFRFLLPLLLVHGKSKIEIFKN